MMKEWNIIYREYGESNSMILQFLNYQGIRKATKEEEEEEEKKKKKEEMIKTRDLGEPNSIKKASKDVEESVL
jgi:hypothetical protein